MAGYLEKAYGYSFNDAVILAEFISYYNAVYYKNIDFFNQNYKPGVTGNITASDCGISTHYSNWPGKTRMVIPLRGIPEKGDLSNIDTSEITDENVIEEIRKEEDKGIDSRKDMTELRERDLDEDQAELDEKKEELEEREEKVDEELAVLEEKEESGTLTEEEKDQKETLEEEKEEISEEKTELENEQDDIDERTEEVIAMRDETALDENKEFDNESDGETLAVYEDLPQAMPVYLLRIDTMAEGVPFGTMVKYDVTSGTIMKVSPVNSIRGKTLFENENGIVAIAGKKSEDSAVKLVLLDKETLEIKTESEVVIFEGSVLVSDGNSFFCISETMDAGYRVASFDSSMASLAISNISVLKDSPLYLTEGSLIVQGEGSSLHKLNITDLSETK